MNRLALTLILVLAGCAAVTAPAPAVDEYQACIVAAQSLTEAAACIQGTTARP